jgi:DNA modification methylase
MRNSAKAAVQESESVWRKRPRKPLSEENKPGRYDSRNTVNDLTGREWLLLTRSFWFTEPSVDDKLAYKHPAPFLVGDVERLIKLFTKQGMVVLDPFVGSGTSLLAANKLGRKAIGVDLNASFKDLALSRMFKKQYTDYQYIVGDAGEVVDQIETVDYIVTSPPYYNILKNRTKGIRHFSGKAFRMAARDGVKYYTDDPNDLGNAGTYAEFIERFARIMRKCFSKLQSGRYCTVIISDFTVNKAEVCVQADVVDIMQTAGYSFCGTTILLQPVKPLYPFGYPYSYKINHHHQNMMTFRKPVAV